MGQYQSREIKLFKILPEVKNISCSSIRNKNIYIFGSIEPDIVKYLASNDAIVVGEYNVKYNSFRKSSDLPFETSSNIIINNSQDALSFYHEELSKSYHDNLTMIVNIKHSRIVKDGFIQNAHILILTTELEAMRFNIPENIIMQVFPKNNVLCYYPHDKTYYILSI